MVFILTKSSVSNGGEFFQGYKLLDDIRKSHGCLNSRYFTNHLNKNVVTILSEWPQFNNFNTYVQTSSKTYNTDLEDGKVHLERLEKRQHRIIKTIHTNSDFYLLAKIHTKNSDLYFNKFPQIYSDQLLGKIGVHEVELFVNLNNSTRITILSRWGSKQMHDEWFRSDLRIGTRLIDLIKYTDYYELTRM